MDKVDLMAKLMALEEEIDNEKKEAAPQVPKRKWALSLGGGGGKASYEIGVWLALRELKIEEDVIAVAGTSSGGLNAALFSLGDYDNAKAIWQNIIPKTFLNINDSTISGPLEDIVKRSLTSGLCSREGLLDIINTKVPMNKLAEARVPAYVCVAQYNSDLTECLTQTPTADYVSLSEVGTEDAKKLLLATSAMPYIYPPEIIHDKVYRDGGIVDLVPIKPLTTTGADALVVVKLDKYNRVDTSLYSNFSEVVEINPSHELGDFLDGTIDFDNNNVLYRMLLGYYDTLRLFKIREYEIAGRPLPSYEKARMEEEDYQKILAEIRRDKVFSSYNNNLDKINNLFDKFK